MLSSPNALIIRVRGRTVIQYYLFMGLLIFTLVLWGIIAFRDDDASDLDDASELDDASDPDPSHDTDEPKNET